MQFASVRIITDDVPRLADFYEALTGLTPERVGEVFAVFRADTGTLAIGHVATTASFADAMPAPGSRAPLLVEFLVDDVEEACDRARQLGAEVALEPTTMPWGNRSAIVRDPDGTLINLFAPPAS
ncbi:VOC family protein [Homoserinibacter sp. GY 40078]|uniref:VOC family protein n=1 Tax=Homoserinibacter sp. GY 40078 TaxID=2603275 RepID=UPI0011CA90F1|nr:VOC family protein [Homoserinibacter sp. GY 40078]TXK18794.1 VOC family protein [Homoserinibacter sp. GY 40078]